jgi:hypothetical protein
MVALSSADSHQPLSLIIGQELVALLNQYAQPDLLLGEMAELLGRRLAVKICLVAVGQPSDALVHLSLWSDEAQNSLTMTNSRFWQYSWIKKISLSDTPMAFALSGISTARRNRVWKLTPTISLKSGLGLRTFFHGAINGMVICGDPEVKNWESEEKLTLGALSPNLGLAAHLTQNLLSSLKHSNRTKLSPLATVVEESPIIKLWYDATRHQLDQQRQWNEKLIHNIITIMSDQTRNPLANIRLGIEMLKKCPYSPQMLEQKLGILEQEWRKLNDINDKILQLKNIKSDLDTILLQRLDFIALMENLVQEFQQLWQTKSGKQLQLVRHWPTDKILIQTNASHLQQIFRELLTNAEKFAQPHSQVEITIKEVFLDEQAAVQVACRNLSRCIKPSHLALLFDPFYREQWVIDSAVPGIGLGLTIAQTLVDHLNGTIEVASDPLTGTDSCWITFNLIIPGRVPDRR